MERDYSEEQKYILAKKRVEKIKGFYIHLAVFIVINIFISAVIVFGLMNDGTYNFIEAVTHFGTYSTWLFWGIGLFFHWLGVFGSNLFFGKDWEKKKIEQYMDDNKF
ncbi:2TM domain-containing protein [Tenacibaculum sp. HL-MS23]|uniref:2TM domain-containing protein n=1 Tax=Tenacibaculum TaxID=104267 RepID=UPI001C4F8761|nr:MULTISPECIES: 2TM domain-containing protein [Tenacibaculum]QXP74076.1 2TM domain-containing protein [Tenacibaculum sp. AHE14PA]QXP75556.1 2TM domain-containing protein [Tenacibaculum sp. AHE15PA]WNW02110.1 2TM domain-containing protein [Tenacibaculum sp. HL-MS23]